MTLPELIDALKRWGYPPNADKIHVTTVTINQANLAIRLPAMSVHRGDWLLIKSRFTNGGLIYVAENQPNATDPNQAWDLQANEFIAWRIKDPQNFIWVSGTVAGDVVVLGAEVAIPGV
jgi:hypothetical protein